MLLNKHFLERFSMFGSAIMAKHKLNSPKHRVQTVCSNPELLCKEMDHLRKALTQCKYPKWALDKVEKRLNRPSREVNDGANNQGTTDTQATTNEVAWARILLYVWLLFTSSLLMAHLGICTLCEPSLCVPLSYEAVEVWHKLS